MKSRDEIWSEWQDLVNMAPSALKDWLATDESRAVGDTGGEGESTGHKSGRRILRIKAKKKADLTENDWSHMARVVGYVKRHKAQGGPEQDAGHSKWRHSLMNWGHDPMA